jgi:hypothetical protein
MTSASPTNFSPTDAAFEGFRFTRERPGAVAAWGGAILAFNLASAVVGALIGGSALVDFSNLVRASSFDLFAFASLLPRLLPALAAATLINMAGSAVIYPSAMRMFLRRDDHVTFRAGEDERRTLILLIVYGLLDLVASAISGVCLGFLFNIVTGVFPSVNDAVVAVIPWATVRGFLSKVLIALPGMALVVRLSLAPVIAVDRKRISFKESWLSTRGHFWPLAGSLFMSIALLGIAAFVALLVILPLASAMSIAPVAPDRTTLADLIKPAAIFASLLNAAIFAMALPFIFGPLVRAYQAYDAPDTPGAPSAP